MVDTFDKWWKEIGRALFVRDDGTTRATAEAAFDAGIEIGMARSRNYTANEVEMPNAVTFANGRTVRIPAGIHRGDVIYLEVE